MGGDGALAAVAVGSAFTVAGALLGSVVSMSEMVTVSAGVPKVRV